MSTATFLSLPCPKCGVRMRYAGSTPSTGTVSGSRLHHYVCTSADCSARFTLDRADRLTESDASDRAQVRFTKEGDFIRMQTNGLTLALVPRAIGSADTLVTVEALPGIEAANPHIEFIQTDAD